MIYNILTFILENAVGLLIGILSASLAATLGYGIWLFFQKRAAKFCILHGITYLKIILLNFIAPILLSLIIWITFRLSEKRNAFYGGNLKLSKPMTIGLIIFVIIWMASTISVFIYQYTVYWKIRRMYFNSVPVEDADILAQADKWIQRLGIHKRVMLFYNEELSSPTIIYYNKGYHILLPVYAMSENELDIVFLHELTHLKNNDILTKNIAFYVNAVHSFNPISYLLRKQIGNWAEVNCDMSCCETIKDDIGSMEYFRCIINMKKRCQDVIQPDRINCLFENKKLLKFRIDAMHQVRKAEKRHCRRYVVVPIFLSVIIMAVSLCTVSYAVTYCYEKTLNYTEEEYSSEDSEVKFKEVSKDDFFNGAEITCFDEDILNNSEGISFLLDAGEIADFSLPEQYSGSLLVCVVSTGGSFQLGFIDNGNGIKYMDGESTGVISIEAERIEEGQLFIKNTERNACQIELFISEMLE